METRKAQPVEKLTTAYKKFLTRSMRQLKPTDEDVMENHLPARRFGTVLTKQTNNSISSLMDQHSQMPKVDLKPWHSLGARAERNKENSAIPSKWTSTKIPQRPGQRIRRPPPGPCIEIFVDEESSE
ncbi:mitotic spindle checkpoint protein bubr1 [Phtheirospermum japonicum]|uniref:Mitotic spindle checkpoint protein bubr1 n=1 Tax=Phtheirospermum japonicum TaxID=374723 RepID=A0A830CSD0_9LAMI|nr:mitotic spindle checkpoint protein bubr1 [Phtheirospermum japonicum]